MSEGILVPAFPTVLRPGLLACDGCCRWFVVVDPDNFDDVFVADIGSGETEVVRREALRLDLRDPAVRDAVVRAIRRKLRPGEPEPLTAPLFYYGGGCDRWAGFAATARASWWLESGVFKCGWWDADVDDPAQGVAALAALRGVDVDHHDRDLLALAAVARAVLS